MRLSARAVSAAAALGVSLGLAACARRSVAPTASSPEFGHAGSFGAIVALRPIPAAAPAGLLSAIGATAGGAAAAPAVEFPALEFIVHQDDGRTISVVQTNESRLRLGERVAIGGGARARLARGAPPPPGG
jgi:outer membrane lipoprotein SlyB